MWYAQPENTFVPQLADPPPPAVIESELRDGYNVIDRDGHVVATFADITAAMPLMGNPGVAIRRHPPRAVNRYVRVVSKPAE